MLDYTGRSCDGPQTFQSKAQYKAAVITFQTLGYMLVSLCNRFGAALLHMTL